MLAALLPTTLVDPSRPQNAPRIRSLALQHFRPKQPLFSFSRSEERPENIALSSEGPAFRVWLPYSRRCSLAAPALEAFFSLQRSWASPFRALLPSSNPKPVSRLRFRSCALLQDQMGLVPALQRFNPTRRAVSLNATQRINSGRDQLPSWVLRFLGFSPETAQEKIISFFSFPFHPEIRKPHDFRIRGIIGFSVPLRSAFPLAGCQPVQPSLPTAFAISSSQPPATDYFFLSRALEFLQTRSALS
jgi:hypothetical protein